MKRFGVSLAALLLAVAVPGTAQNPPPAGEARPPLLRALDGSWRMSGDVMGQPVTYSMNARSALAGEFTEMRMKDVQVPAQYEAVVFIGVDKASQALIVHWMDSTGPEGSIPHGTGRISGNRMQILFPYQSGHFRNTMTYDAGKGAWTFVLESAQPDGSWKHFARYDVKRI